MQLETHISFVRILVQMIDTIGIEGGGAALDAVHGISFAKQEFSQVCAILSGHACD